MWVTFNRIQELFNESKYSNYFTTVSEPKPGCFTLISFGLLVFPKSTGEGSCPHVQGRSGREGEEEEEGNLETKPIHQASGQSAEHQLPQHLESSQETVVGRLQGELAAER